jgi:hypothetical protein
MLNQLAERHQVHRARQSAEQGDYFRLLVEVVAEAEVSRKNLNPDTVLAQLSETGRSFEELRQAALHRVNAHNFQVMGKAPTPSFDAQRTAAIRARQDADAQLENEVTAAKQRHAEAQEREQRYLREIDEAERQANEASAKEAEADAAFRSVEDRPAMLVELRDRRRSLEAMLPEAPSPDNAELQRRFQDYARRHSGNINPQDRVEITRQFNDQHLADHQAMLRREHGPLVDAVAVAKEEEADFRRRMLRQ